jgi:hypothetical protein
MRAAVHTGTVTNKESKDAESELLIFFHLILFLLLKMEKTEFYYMKLIGLYPLLTD